MEVIIFTIANSSYAINLEYIKRIVEIEEEFTEVAGSHKCIDGIIAYDERTIHVLNLPRLFNMEDSEEPNILVLYQYDNQEFFLSVNTIVGVQAIEDASIKQFSSETNVDNVIELGGVIDLKSSEQTQLITIIQSIKLPE